MAPNLNTGMPKNDMKRLLVRSKTEPVSCAIGLGESGHLGLLMMHRTKNGKACEKMLKDEFPEAKNTRFGTAYVDIDDNPKLVKITVNRAVTGMAKRLIMTLKGTGFTKVRIVMDDGTEVESHEEDDAEAAVAEGGAPAPVVEAGAAPPVAEAPAEPAPAVAVAPPPPPPPGPAAPSPEVKAAQTAQLQKLLAALAPQIPAAAGDDAARKAVLMKFATDANVNLKTGNLVYAATALSQLKKALEAGAAAPGTAPDTTKVIAEARVKWAGTLDAIKKDVARLQAALETTYAGQPFAGEVVTSFQSTVAPVLATFDSRLDSVLGRFEAAAADQRGPLISEARGLIDSYTSFADTNALVEDLDDNPFVPLGIRSSVHASLGELAKALH